MVGDSREIYDRRLPVDEALTLRQQVDTNVNDERVAMTIGLALATVGIPLAPTLVDLLGASESAAPHDEPAPPPPEGWGGRSRFPRPSP